MVNPHSKCKTWYCLAGESPETKKQEVKNTQQRQKIRPLWARLKVWTNYQVQGAYAHLMQRGSNELMDALQHIESPMEYFNDPLRLQVPYEYLEARLIEPPDCIVAKVVAIASIGAIYAYPLAQGATYLLYLQT